MRRGTRRVGIGDSDEEVVGSVMRGLRKGGVWELWEF